LSLGGACQCGAVRIATDVAPLTIRACWCRDCQKLAGGGAIHNAFFKTEDVVIEGDVRWHDVVADSGNRLARGFCSGCGTPLLTQSHVRRHLIGVRVGVFDDTSELAPHLVIWTDSAPAWARIDPDLPTANRQPPPVA
jgi:hypothetical protein